jgi:hypothetical protein
MSDPDSIIEQAMSTEEGKLALSMAFTGAISDRLWAIRQLAAAGHFRPLSLTPNEEADAVYEKAVADMIAIRRQTCQTPRRGKTL